MFFVDTSADLVRQSQRLGVAVMPSLDGTPCAVMVAKDVTSLPGLAEVSLRLLGGSLVSPAVFLGVRQGPRLTLIPATGIKREVWLSDRFRAANPAVADAIKTMTMAFAVSDATPDADSRAIPVFPNSPHNAISLTFVSLNGGRN